MFGSYSCNYIFTRAVERGYIRRVDWERLCLASDAPTHDITVRLMYAIRRGRLTIVD